MMYHNLFQYQTAVFLPWAAVTVINSQITTFPTLLARCVAVTPEESFKTHAEEAQAINTQSQTGHTSTRFLSFSFSLWWTHTHPEQRLRCVCVLCVAVLLPALPLPPTSRTVQFWKRPRDASINKSSRTFLYLECINKSLCAFLCPPYMQKYLWGCPAAEAGPPLSSTLTSDIT